MVIDADPTGNVEENELAPRHKAGEPSLGQYVPEDQPAFIVGITGHMDPCDPEMLEERVRRVFRFLRHGSASGEGVAAVRELREELAPLVDSEDRPDRRRKSSSHPYDEFLEQWPGLGSIPIVVLSSLAPGADQIVATVALEKEFQQSGFHLRCPLPFPLEVYREASTFRREAAGDATEQEREAIAVENEQRQRDLRTIVGDDHDQRCFVVALEEDLELDRHQRGDRYQTDLMDRQRRRKRYRAAGEYIAAYSHLMIAIWDHVDDHASDEGTAAIISARRKGLTPGLLPTTPNLALPTEGPVLHLFTVRGKRADAMTTESLPSVANSTWAIRWLFPITKIAKSPAGDQPHRDDLDASWQCQGLTQFARAAASLVKFDALPRISSQRAERHLKDLFAYKGNDIYPKIQHTRLHGKVKRVADLRRRAADAQRAIKKKRSRTLGVLFLLTLFGAVCSHAFNHWHSQIHSHHEDEEHQLDVAGAAQHDGGLAAHADHEAELLKDRKITAAIGLLGALFFVTALVTFWYFRPLQFDEDQTDLRAIAEGARVQTMWHMAGVGASVSANYMQRQRGELTYIRKTISSAGMPYEEAARAFAELGHATQIDLLKCVAFNWIRGRDNVAQANFFADKQSEKVHDIHRCHKAGFVLALTGLLLGLLYVLASCLEVWEFELLRRLSDWIWAHLPPPWYIAAGLFALAAAGLATLFMGIPDAKQYAHSIPLFRKQMLKNLGRYLMPASVLAAVAFLLAVLLEHFSPFFPAVEPWMIILSAWLVIAGGLAIAWPERNLDAEFAYQYGTMYVLFDNAADRIESMIDELEHLHRQSEEAMEEAERSRTQREYPKQLRRIQLALYDLGTEALDENAEWLILHRARPLEPVMAG